MKSYCVKDHSTGRVFKVFVTEEGFKEYLKLNPDIDECIDCVECHDAPSICIE